MDAQLLLQSSRLVPVVVIEDKTIAADLARALLNAGVTAIEVTLRTTDALQAIEEIASKVPDILLGAGSVRQPDHFFQIKERGARFAVSPGASDRLLEAAKETALPFVPGAVTPSEMIALLEKGYGLQKFFPAEQSGGLQTLKAIAAPLPEVRFFPTGGINGELAPLYLKESFIQCVGGSWFVSKDALAVKDFSRIEADAREAVEALND